MKGRHIVFIVNMKNLVLFLNFNSCKAMDLDLAQIRIFVIFPQVLLCQAFLLFWSLEKRATIIRDKTHTTSYFCWCSQLRRSLQQKNWDFWSSNVNTVLCEQFSWHLTLILHVITIRFHQFRRCRSMVNTSVNHYVCLPWEEENTKYNQHWTFMKDNVNIAQITTSWKIFYCL